MPVAVMEGQELVIAAERRRLGAKTLQGLPGVHSSSFGAVVAGPVIRCLDGAR